jgi:hypothetical protein
LFSFRYPDCSPSLNIGYWTGDALMQRSCLKFGVFFILLFSTILLWGYSPVWASPGQSPRHQTVPTRVKSKTPTATVKPGTPTITPTVVTTSESPSQTATAKPVSLTPTQTAAGKPGQSTLTQTPSLQSSLPAPTTEGSEPPTVTLPSDTPTQNQDNIQTQLAATRQFSLTLTVLEATASQTTAESLAAVSTATEVVQTATSEARPSMSTGEIATILPICGMIVIIMGVAFFVLKKRRSGK